MARASRSSGPRSVFDGTWRPTYEPPGPYEPPDTLTLVEGIYHCHSCHPPFRVAADGQEHAVEGHPRFETLSVEVIDDRTVRLTGRRRGELSYESTMVVAPDGSAMIETRTASMPVEGVLVPMMVPVAGGPVREPRPVLFRIAAARIRPAMAGAHQLSGSWKAVELDLLNHDEDTTYRIVDDSLTMFDRMGRSYTVRIDGASAPYHGDPRFTEVPVRRIDERTLEETNLRGGKVVQVARWRVHPNGRTMHVRFDDTRGHVMEQTGRKLPRGNAMTRRRRKPPVPDQAALPPASGRTTSVPHRPHRRGVGPMVSLLPMEQHVWEAWRIASIATYAAEMVRVGAWAPDSAEERAVSEFARIVPNGRQTAGHEFRSIVAPAGEVVGALWFAPDELGRGTAFIWDIAIERAHRGEGYGRAAMEALEPLARSLGYDSIRLHVVGDNAVARSLYESVGYSEADVTMVKHIG